MIGPNSSIFDSPSFIQKLLKKKTSSKYNIKPLYTSDIMTEVDPWRKQFNAATKMANSYSFNLSPKKKTKTYNIQQQNQPQQNYNYPLNQPSLYPSPSISSLTNNSSIVSDSTLLMPIPSVSTPLPQPLSQPDTALESQTLTPPKQRKRPNSAEILIKMMDQRLLQLRQLDLQRENDILLNQHKNPLMSKSLSATTSTSVPNFHSAASPARKNKIITNQKSIPSTLLRRSDSLQQPQIHHSPSSHQHLHKLKTSKSVLHKLNSSPKPLPYILTQDNDEQDRMVAQHYLLRTAFGSDYNSPIRSQLKKGMIVLDVGCGPGTWTMEMSTAFPKSTFIGIDQGAFYPKDIKPRNCHFRTCGSLLVGQNDNNKVILPFPDNSIDYIYQRDMNWAFTCQTWQPLLLEYKRILKPGGWMEFIEPDFETQNSFGSELLMNEKIIAGLTARQQDPYAVHRLPTMLTFLGFGQVENFAQHFPLGWGTDYSINTSKTSIITEEAEGSTSSEGVEISSKEKRDQFCSEFSRAMSSQYLFLLKSLKPWLSSIMNLSSEKYDDYVSGLPAEWRKARTYINWHCIIAQKPFV